MRTHSFMKQLTLRHLQASSLSPELVIAFESSTPSKFVEDGLVAAPKTKKLYTALNLRMNFGSSSEAQDRSPSSFPIASRTLALPTILPSRENPARDLPPGPASDLLFSPYQIW
mmetsp:Transcript_10402/g.15078  ORF Transcript_10402/g.15078 Transcript_10402/m.15078 type:complete len:114 (-) Transcript_10402:50-391(-)